MRPVAMALASKLTRRPKGFKDDFRKRIGRE
jgi:hypothetical protein